MGGGGLWGGGTMMFSLGTYAKSFDLIFFHSIQKPKKRYGTSFRENLTRPAVFIAFLPRGPPIWLGTISDFSPCWNRKPRYPMKLEPNILP